MAALVIAMPPGSSKFEGLGNDILHLICGELYAMHKVDLCDSMIYRRSEGGAALLNLCTTSKTIRQVVYPILCSEITLEYSHTEALDAIIVSKILDDQSDMKQYIRKLIVRSYYLRIQETGSTTEINAWKEVFSRLRNLRNLSWDSAVPLTQTLLTYLEERHPSLRLSMGIGQSYKYPKSTILSTKALLVPSKLVYALKFSIDWQILWGLRAFDSTEFDVFSYFLKGAINVKKLMLKIDWKSKYYGDESAYYAEFQPPDNDRYKSVVAIKQDFSALSVLHCGHIPLVNGARAHARLICQRILTNLSTWSSLNCVHLHNMPELFAFQLLEGRCPELQTLSFALSENNYIPAIIFIRSLEMLKSLSIHYSVKSLEEIFSVVSVHRNSIQDLHLSPNDNDWSLVINPADRVVLSAENLLGLSSWPELCRVGFEISPNDAQQLTRLLPSRNVRAKQDLSPVVNAIRTMINVKHFELTVDTFARPHPFVYVSKKLLKQIGPPVFWALKFKDGYAKAAVQRLWMDMQSKRNCQVQFIQITFKCDFYAELNLEIFTAQWGHSIGHIDYSHHFMHDGRKYSIGWESVHYT